MKISELRAHLLDIELKEGDLNVCGTESQEYWGTLYYHIDKGQIRVTDYAQPDGPKSGKQERAVIFEPY